MPFTAKVYKIFIASPGDLEIERQIAREVIHEWNYLHSESNSIVLIPVGYETHSWPDSGSHPQAIITKQSLVDCDLLLALFWAKVGTATPNAESGTIEEYQTHIQAGKPAMVYFSNKQIPPDSIDSNQLERLRAFKQSISSKCKYEAFNTEEEFSSKLKANLVQRINSIIANEKQLNNQEFRSLEEQSYSPSERVQVLLKCISQQTFKRIHKYYTSHGVIYCVNSSNFPEDHTDDEERAEWDDAFNEMLNNELIVSDSTDPSSYRLTKKGNAVMKSVCN